MGLTTNGLGKSGARPSISIWTTDPPGKCKNGSKITGSFASYAIDLKKYRWRCCRPARLWKKPNPRNFEYHPPNKSKPTPRDPRNVGFSTRYEWLRHTFLVPARQAPLSRTTQVAQIQRCSTGNDA